MLRVKECWILFESVSHSVMSDSMQPMNFILQAVLSKEFSKQEYWSG